MSLQGSSSCIQYRLLVAREDLLVCADIGDKGNDRQCERDPHRKIREDLKLRDIDDHQNDHDHLERGLELAPVIRRDHNAVLSGDQSETADDEFSGDNDDDDPGRDRWSGSCLQEDP